MGTATRKSERIRGKDVKQPKISDAFQPVKCPQAKAPFKPPQSRKDSVHQKLVKESVPKPKAKVPSKMTPPVDSDSAALVALLKAKEKEEEKKRKRREMKDNDSDDEVHDSKVEGANQLLDQANQMNADSGDADVSRVKWGQVVFKRNLVSKDTQKVCPQRGRTLGRLENGMLEEDLKDDGACNAATAQALYHAVTNSKSKKFESMALRLLSNLLKSDEIELQWRPSLADIRATLASYGYSDTEAAEEKVEECPESEEPPSFLSLLELVSACCSSRTEHEVFTTSDAEELCIMVARCLLHRVPKDCRELVSSSITKCLASILHYFTDQEWAELSAELPKRLLSGRVDQVRVIENLPKDSERTSDVRKKVAIQWLHFSFDKTVSETPDDVVSLFTSAEENCDLNLLYFQLRVADCWLEETALQTETRDSWVNWLAQKTRSMTSILHPGASKVRQTAATLKTKYLKGL
eukprot:jgi/Mesen1/9550/ME000640S08908